MSHLGKGYDINQTFIVEPVGSADILSACTGIYTSALVSCSGNTQIIMGTGVISFDGNLYTDNDLSANTINASTFLSGGTNLIDIINLSGISGGTFDNGGGTLTLNRAGSGDIIITGFTDYYTTGTTVIGNTVYFDRNDALSAYTLDLGSFSSDTFVTGVTFSNNQLIIGRNDGVNLNTYINSFTGLTIAGDFVANTISANTVSATTFYGDGSNLTGLVTQDTYVTGGTYYSSSGTTLFTNNTGGTFNVSGYFKPSDDVFVTGGTYSNGTANFINNTGGTFTVSGFPIGGGGGQLFYLNISQAKNGNRYLSITGSTASQQSTGTTIGAGATGTIASFQSDQLNTTLIPGGIWSFYLHSYKQNTNASFNIFVEGYKLSSGGTQTLLFTTDPAPVTTNSPNPSMQLSDGYFSGSSVVVTDSILAVVRATNTGNQSHTITLFSEGNQHYSYAISSLPTQQGLTCDTLSGCSIIQTIQSDILSKLSTSGGTITGNLIVNNSLSASTYYNLPIDIFVTGGTYSNGSTTFTNNTGGTFSVTGLYTGATDVFVTGGTYNNNTFTYTNNTGGTFNVLFNTVTGLTINGNLTVTGTTSLNNVTATSVTAPTISATTFTATTVNAINYFSGGTNLTTVIINTINANAPNPAGSKVYSWQNFF